MGGAEAHVLMCGASHLIPTRVFPLEHLLEPVDLMCSWLWVGSAPEMDMLWEGVPDCSGQAAPDSTFHCLTVKPP